MKKFKSIIRFLHLWLGLLSGLVVFTVAITGSIYVFEEEFRNCFYKDLLTVKSQNVQRKSLDEIVQAAKKEFPKLVIRNIHLKEDATASVEVNFKNKLSVFVNPYSGKVLGSMNKDTDFFGVVLKIHRSLYLGDAGKMITGISALIFFFMILSGIILWWPKRGTKVKRKFSFLKSAGFNRKIYDLHSVFGFYASWILIFSALTGLIFAFKWVEAGMYKLTNSTKEEVRLHSVYADTSALSLEKILARSKALAPSTEDYLLLIPEDSVGVIRVNMQYAQNGFFKKTDQFFFDRYSGELMQSRLFKDASTGEKMRATNYNIHTGKVLGLLGQLLVFFAAIIAASLPVTGFMMWWKKRKQKLQSLE